MIEKFSSQYYIGQVYVTPLVDSQDFGQIRQDEYDAIRREIYGQTILEPPLVMKIENKYVQLKPTDTADEISEQTTRLPRKVLQELKITNTPSVEEVFFPTKEAIKQFDKMGFFPK